MGAHPARARARTTTVVEPDPQDVAVAASRLMVDRLLRLRADQASGRLSRAEFVERRLHLLDRRQADLPYDGPDRRRRPVAAG